MLKRTEVAAPLVAGLVVLVTLLGLIGTAIRDPHPHDIPVGLVGPAPAVQQLSDGLSSKAPGTFRFTTYSDEAAARAALDSGDVDGVLVIGSGGPHLIVLGSAGDAVAGVITAVFTSVFAAQGAQLTVEVAHPFGSGDPHGLILFFLALAGNISTFVVQVLLYLRARNANLATWLGVTTAWAVLAGLAGTAMAAWIVGGYELGNAAAIAGLVALAALAGGSVIGGLARLIGAPGLGLGGLVLVLLNLISSGGPAGPYFLPDAYRALSPWMPAGQLLDALRRALYLNGNGVAGPVLVVTAWFVAGVALMVVGAAVRRRGPASAAQPAFTG